VTPSRTERCYRLVYVSRATAPMSRAALVELLQQSRAHNSVRGITGLLVYRDRSFVQVLEGEQAQVDALYATIAADPRHTDVVLVGSEHDAARHFPDWSMGFDVSTHDAHDLDGFNDVLDGDSGMRVESDLVRGLLDLLDPQASRTDTP
jgi:hypothetical protein